jgi:hypothetical protein
MTKEEYQLLKGPRAAFNPARLRNQADRTLLLGYDQLGNSRHTYLQGGVLHHVVYAYPADLQCSCSSDDGAFQLSDLVPNKRIYPEACDLEFVEILRANDIHLPFTTYRADWPLGQYYGKLKEELFELRR